MTGERLVLASRPQGMPGREHFRLERYEAPEPADGEVLLRTRYLSIDPYMRGRMSSAKSYAQPVELGQTMVGATVSEVLESRDPAIAPGAMVLAYSGWQTHATARGSDVRVLDPGAAPVTYALGLLGMPGQTAYCALLDIGNPQAGETVLISAASGAVGSVAGQIAKIRGARAVGVAGSDEKCRYVIEELGFDACINRRAQALDEALRQTCPDGIDVYFDNTAGAILAAAMRRLRLHARIPLVGLIEQYNDTTPPPGPNLAPLLTARATITGFLVSDHGTHTGAFLRDMTQWLREGRLRYREDVTEGLERAPDVLAGLLTGSNFGKAIIRVT